MTHNFSVFWTMTWAVVVKIFSLLMGVILKSFPPFAQVINDERPPTPPRGRPSSNAPSLAFFE